MAKKIVIVEVSTMEAGQIGVWGKIFNVYDSVANAVANGDTGLVPVYSVDRITGTASVGAVTQHGKNSGVAQAGISADEFGKLVFAVDTASYPVIYLNSTCGRQGGAYKVVTDSEVPVVEESSSSEEESSSSSVVEESSSSVEESSSSSVVEESSSSEA